MHCVDYSCDAFRGLGDGKQGNGRKEYQEALKLGQTFVKSHPLNVGAIFELAYAFHKLGNEDSAQHYLYQGWRILKAMNFCGDGLTSDTPVFALGPSDGQVYIQKVLRADIGVMGSGTDKNGNFLDILQAKYQDGRTVTLHFIIQHATNKMFGGKTVEEELKEKKPLEEN